MLYFLTGFPQNLVYLSPDGLWVLHEVEEQPKGIGPCVAHKRMNIYQARIILLHPTLLPQLLLVPHPATDIGLDLWHRQSKVSKVTREVEYS